MRYLSRLSPVLCYSASVAGQPCNMAVSIPRLGLTLPKDCVERAILKAIKELGYEKPKQFQIDVIMMFIKGKDVFVCQPTGSGKSICFACIPSVFDTLRKYSVGLPSHHCIAIVVSPLFALTSIGCQEMDNDRIINGDMQLVYLSPESVLSHTCWREMFKNPCYQNNLVCLAIDEVEKWYVINLLGSTFLSILAGVHIIMGLSTPSLYQ